MNLRCEGYLLSPVEREREPRQDRDIDVELDALQPAHTEHRQRVFALQVGELLFDQGHGYPIRIRHGNHLTVMTPAGFVLFAGRVEMAQAHRIIRIHRGERRHP